MKVKEMTPRERVLASLAKQPVDRIPYFEHFMDINVALKTSAMMTGGIPDHINVTLAEMGKAFASLGTPGATMRDSLRIMNSLEKFFSESTGRNNVSYINGMMAFNDYAIYDLNPSQAHLGWSADGVIKCRDDLKKIKFTNVEHIVEDAKEFLKTKGDFAAGAEVFMGIDPAMHSMGVETFLCACLEDPEFVEEFLGMVCTHFADVIGELCKLDFDYVFTPDDIAYHTTTMFSPRVYRDILLPQTRKVAEKITKPWIYHSDGNLMPIWDDLLSQGMDAIHPLEPGAMDLVMLRDKYKDRVTFVGGVSLANLECGEPEDTINDTLAMLDLFKGKASYMMATCNSVTENVKPENLKAMLDTLKEHGDMEY